MDFSPVLSRIRRSLAALFFAIGPRTAVLAVTGYVLVSYVLLALAGETELIHPETFFYYLIISGSTVGYGDFGPQTLAGRWVVGLWVVPLGISIFAMVLARAGVYLTDIYTRGKKGLNMLNLSNHLLVIGWNGQRTLRLLELVSAKTNGRKQDIVLCVTQDMENPLPGQIHFVQVESFCHPETMTRACIETAGRIIIDTEQDDVTLTTALFCAKMNPPCHKTAYLHDESLIDLMATHCPKVEVVPSVSVEMLARSAMDPKSSQVHKQLLDSTEGMTQYSCRYQPQNPEQTLTFSRVFSHLKERHNATVIGIHFNAAPKVTLNPPLDTEICARDTLFYIADHRLDHNSCFPQGI